MNIRQKGRTVKVTQDTPFIVQEGCEFCGFAGGKFILPGITGTANLVMHNGDETKMNTNVAFTPKSGTGTTAIPPAYTTPNLVPADPSLSNRQKKIEAELAGDEKEIVALKAREEKAGKDLAG